MKVVIDTNIVVSAVLKDRDSEVVIRFVIGHPEYEWIGSRDILTEYTESSWPVLSLPMRII